jgi:uncharacterized membrane protein YidH (DUF202 family)
MTTRTDDPGLAVERTVLAWNRSAISLGAAGVLLIRLSFDTPVPEIGLAVGGIDLLIAGWLWARATPRRPRRARLLQILTAATVATAVAAVGLAFVD